MRILNSQEKNGHYSQASAPRLARLEHGNDKIPLNWPLQLLWPLFLYWLPPRILAAI